MLSRTLFALLLATTLPAFAKERPVYQDSVLISFKMMNQTGYYTVDIGGQTFVLYPAPSLAKAGGVFLTMGIATAFYRSSVLYGQLPGTPLKIRSDGNGDFYVRVGKRESEYKLAAAY